MSLFKSAPSTTITWRRLDRLGHETAQLSEDQDGAVIDGTAVFSDSGRACRLDYRVVCDADWRTVSTRVTGWLGQEAIEIDVAVDEARVWTLNGRPCPDVEGCDDIDLSFSPATNLLPIRRVRLPIGGRAAVRAAWLRFPNPALEPLEQTYERVGESRYRYESGSGAFVAMLETNAAGFVTEYPGLWRVDRQAPDRRRAGR